MKKLALFSALFALTVALFFVACKKDEAPQTSSLEFANPNNPYDYVGVKHNEGLDILKKYANEQDLNMAQDFQVLADYGYGNGDYKPFATDFAILLSSKDPIKSVMDKYRNEGRVSEDLYAAMLQLNEIVNTKGLLPELAPAVKKFETLIPGLNLKASETEILYYAASIARYSNAYWMAEGKTTSAERFPWRTVVIVAADVAGGIAGGSVGGPLGAIEGAAAASELADWLWDNAKIASSPNVGWPWGGGIIGYPCNPGWACPCTIELNPFENGPFYMTGTAFALSPNEVVMPMDGSALDPAFFNLISGGNFDLSTDFTVPQNIVDMAYASCDLPSPTEPTVFTQGPKQVHLVEGTHCIVFPVTYQNGNVANWYVVINQAQ